MLLENPEIDRDRVRAVLSEFEKGLDRGTELTERFDALSDDVVEHAG